jgi:hypothetical protein
MNPVTIILLLHTMQSEAGTQAEKRIKQDQYCAAVEARAQHREIERVQPASHPNAGSGGWQPQGCRRPVDWAGADRETIAAQTAPHLQIQSRAPSR